MRVWIGLGLFLSVSGLTLAGFLRLPWDPESVGRPYLPPSLPHPFGTDWFGRDILSRVMVGGRASLGISAGAVALGGTFGTALGLLGGLLGGWVDEAVSALGNVLLAFPAVLLALLLSTSVGPGPSGALAAIALFNIPFFIRISRAATWGIREREYVLAARACGAGTLRIIRRHILPNISPLLLVQLTNSFAAAVIAEASLSYLGLGTQPPHPSWGRMLREAQGYLALSPWPAIFPGCVISLTVLGLTMLGDGLRDLIDPSLRRV